jgi:hypothetical protein
MVSPDFGNSLGFVAEPQEAPPATNVFFCFYELLPEVNAGALLIN